MSIDRSYYSFIKQTPIQGGCNCCCNRNPQLAQTGIFGFGFSNNTIMPMNDFGYSSFGFAQGFNFNQFEFSLLNNLNFDINNFFKPLENLKSFFTPFPSNTSFSFNMPTFFVPTYSKATSTDGSKKTSNEKSGKSSSSTSTGATKKQTEQMKQEIGQNDNNFEAQLKAKNVKYNASLGHDIATTVLDNVTGGTGNCAHYVNNALEAGGINPLRDNHAYTRAEVLRKNSNFTEVTVSSEEDLKKLPAGSIIVYQRGVCGYSSEHGHTLAATGNGGGGSDHLQNELKFPTDKEGISVFIPTTKIG